MRCIPTIQIKPLRECALGELVRQPHHSAKLAIVAEGSRIGTRTLVQLGAGEGLPRYLKDQELSSLNQPLISYGQDFLVEISQDELEFGSSEWTEIPGILWLVGGDLIMMVNPPGNQWGVAFLNMQTGMFVENPSSFGTARFAKWELKITGANHLSPISMFSFDALKIKLKA